MLYSETKNSFYKIKHSIHKITGAVFKRQDFARKEKLDPMIIPKYVNQLEKPPVFKPHITWEHDIKKGRGRKRRHNYCVDIGVTRQQMLPMGFPKTRVFGYGGVTVNPDTGKTGYTICSPGPTFEARRGTSVTVKWNNRIKGKHLFAVDPTLHWANPNHMPMDPPKPWPSYPPGFMEAQKPVPTVTHLHGGEVRSESDGHPEAWFTFDKRYGPTYVSREYHYPNEQEATTLWYHDHTLGMTRLNVYAGLAGLYLLRDGRKSKHLRHYTEGRLNLPQGKYEMPLVLQDKSFYTDGSLLFNNSGNTPETHPYWVPGFSGDIMVVNGKVWPNLNVDRCRYRFRVLNASNTRFYNLFLSNGMELTQIGSDGGLLNKPVRLFSLLLAPGERADILVDFSETDPGTTIRLLNNARHPYPFGPSPNPDTMGQILQFTVPVDAPKPARPPELPKRLNCIQTLAPNSPKRILTLNDMAGPTGPLAMYLNGQMWSSHTTETPRVGSTEDWEIVGMTAGAHPIHIHLIQFQVLNRQNIKAAEYTERWREVNGSLPLHHPPLAIPLEHYLLAQPIPPEENEKGWKDTVIVNPGQVTRIRIRYAPQGVMNCQVEPGDNYYSFSPCEGPGYVWHCHLLDHEDNEMMRPMKLLP